MKGDDGDDSIWSLVMGILANPKMCIQVVEHTISHEMRFIRKEDVEWEMRFLATLVEIPPCKMHNREDYLWEVVTILFENGMGVTFHFAKHDEHYSESFLREQRRLLCWYSGSFERY